MATEYDEFRGRWTLPNPPSAQQAFEAGLAMGRKSQTARVYMVESLPSFRAGQQKLEPQEAHGNDRWQSIMNLLHGHRKS